MLQADMVRAPGELEQILELQNKYLRGRVTESEETEQGFLTVEHTFELLQWMHQFGPSIIVRDGNVLAGYALTMSRKCEAIIPVLTPMFAQLDRLPYQGKPVNAYNFYVMGQICVDKKYRGQGAFELLYLKHRELFHSAFDFIITEISTRNHRSLRAHQRIGFKRIHTHRDELDEWDVVVWDWSQGTK